MEEQPTKEDEPIKKVLTRGDILTSDDRPCELYHFPDWGGWLYMRGMTGTQRDEIEQSITATGDKQDITGARARVASRCIVNEDGTPMFTEKDVVALGEKSALCLALAFRIGSKLSGMSDDAMKEIEGNSKAVQSASSTSV